MPKLISLIIVYFMHRQLKNYAFFQKLQQQCNANWLDDLLFNAQTTADKFNRVPIIGSSTILVGSIFLIILLLQTICDFALNSIGTTIFNIVILSYCLFSADKQTYSSVFVTSFEHNFSFLFWFAVLGPVGVVLYWLFLLGGSKSTQANQLCLVKNIADFLYNLHIIAAWLPARITGLIFSLVGDFERGFARWKAILKVLNMPHTELLNTCGEASLGELAVEQASLLVERAFIAWMIVCVLITLIIDF
jgi:AmpE protein